MDNKTITSSAYKPKIDYLKFNIAGVSKADNGEYEAALESFSKAIELNPQNFISYFNRASIKMHIGDIEGARLDFQQSEKFASENKSYI